MADATKAWEKAFNQGSKALQDRLKKVHANNPAFQSWLRSAGHDVQGSVKQSVTYKTSERLKRLQAQSKSGAGYDLKDPEVVRDTIVPLSKDQRAKVAEIERQKKAAEKAAKPAKPKKVVRPPAPKKPLTRDERMSAIARAVAKAKSKSRFDVPTIDPNDADAEDYRDLHKGLHIGGTYKEEFESINEVTKKEAEAVIGGPVKEKPKMAPGKQPAGYRYVRGLARKAMKAGIKKEEVEQVVEQDDSMEKKEMAETQLHFIKYAAEEILEFIKMGGEIEEWYQNKLSKVQSEVESLHSYIEGEKRRTGMVEEIEQVDEKINLVKAKMGDVIKDFQKSDAPQFKGKSQEERRKMALAAKLGAEREAGMREEAEGKVAVTPKEKDLAAHHGDKTRITRGDVIKARLKSVAAKKMGK